MIATNVTKNQVDEISYVVSDVFINSTLDSCRNVLEPSSGARALDFLCGVPADSCTPEVVS